MKIALNCNVEYEEGSFGRYLFLTIKFKMSNKLLKIKRSRTIANSNWTEENGSGEHIDTFSSNEEFYDYCIEVINDKEWLKEQAIDMFNAYCKSQEEELKENSKKDQLALLLKNKKSFQVEVEFKND